MYSGVNKFSINELKMTESYFFLEIFIISEGPEVLNSGSSFVIMEMKCVYMVRVGVAL